MTLNFSSEDSVVCSAAHQLGQVTLQKTITPHCNSDHSSLTQEKKNIPQTFNYKHPDINTHLRIHIFCINRKSEAVVIITVKVHYNVCINSPFVLCPLVQVIEIVFCDVRGEIQPLLSLLSVIIYIQKNAHLL